MIRQCLLQVVVQARSGLEKVAPRRSAFRANAESKRTVGSSGRGLGSPVEIQPVRQDTKFPSKSVNPRGL